MVTGPSYSFSRAREGENLKCKQCNKDIPRGKKYQGEHFTSYYFCSQGCYNMYGRTHTPHKHPIKPSQPSKSIPVTNVSTPSKTKSTKSTTQSKPKPNTSSTHTVASVDGNSSAERRKLTDWIDINWPTVNINWPWITSQIKNIQEIYQLTYKQMRLIMKYAVVYEEVVINPEMGLGQFFPRYIDAGIKFAEQCTQAKEKSKEDNLFEEEIIVMPSKRNTPRKYWGDLTLSD